MHKQTTTNLAIKSLNKRQFEGYGSVFGNKDYGNDIVMQGAFADTLREHKADATLPAMFWMHKPDQVPGVWLDMDEDKHGLYVKGELADTQLGNDTHKLLNMKAVRGLSIGYMIRDADYDDDGTRLIKSVELFETSIVSLAMNPRAQVTHAKSRLSSTGEYVPTSEEFAQVKRDCESWLKSKGFSDTLAKVYVSNLFKEAAGAMSGGSQPGTPDEDELLAGNELDEATQAAAMTAIEKLLGNVEFEVVTAQLKNQLIRGF